jgi:hypothetical protein
MVKKAVSLILFLALVLQLLPNIHGLDAGSYVFRLEPLTASTDLYSVTTVQKYAVAVGRSGAVTVWDGDKVAALTVAQADLFAVACGRVCLAVGKSGTVAEIEPDTLSFRTYRPASVDFKAVYDYGGRFYIMGDQSVAVYRLGGVVEKVVYTGSKLSSIAPAGDRVYASSGSKLLSIDLASGDVSTAADLRSSIRQLYLLDGRVWALTERGLYSGDKVVQPGSFAFMRPHPRGFLLGQGQSILFYDVYDSKLSTLVNLDQTPSDAALYGSAVVAVGAKGYMVVALGDRVMRVFAPPLKYVDAASGAGGAVYIAAEDGSFLVYRQGLFSSYSLGDSPRRVAFSKGLAAVLGRELWVFDGDGFRPAKADIRATDFLDMSASKRSGYWLTLVGGGGRIADIDENGRVKVTQATSANLYATSGGYAVGDKVAVMLGDEPKVAKMDGRMVDVVETACGAVAVSDSGQIAYLQPDAISKTSSGKRKFTTASLNPRGAYVLAATSQGEFILYDGYNATLLPIAVPEEVRAIAWVDEKTALVVTRSSVYRLVEEGYPPPRLEASAPKSLELFAGSSRSIQVELVPRNGFSGKAEIQLWVTGMPGYVSTSPASIEVSVSPMCTAKAQFRVSAFPEAREGPASIVVRLGDVVLSTIAVAVKRSSQPQAGGVVQTPALMDLVLLFAMVATAAGVGSVAARKLRKGRRAGPV